MAATSSPPTELPPGTTEDLPPPSGVVSQADAVPYLTTAPSGSPEPLTPLNTLKPMSSKESKALGSHSTATAMVISTTPTGDSSVSQHCKYKLCLHEKTCMCNWELWRSDEWFSDLWWPISFVRWAEWPSQMLMWDLTLADSSPAKHHLL